MQVHPLIAALRSDPASQRRSQAAMADALACWRSDEWGESLERDVCQFGLGGELPNLPVLGALMRDHANAAECVARFNRALFYCLRREPLGEVPLRHTSSAGFSRLHWVQSGGATLSLCAYEPVAVSREPVAAQFADCETYEIIVSGEARGEFYTLHPDRSGALCVESKANEWRAGDHIHSRACRDTRQYVTVTKSLLVLQLSRVPKTPRPTCEYRLSDNALIGQASGDKRASEKLMALAVLGALEHRAGIGAMDDFATDTEQDLHARWEAVRQILGMDAARGMDLLNRLGQRGTDPLAQPALNLIERLRQNEPALSPMEKESA